MCSLNRDAIPGRPSPTPTSFVLQSLQQSRSRQVLQPGADHLRSKSCSKWNSARGCMKDLLDRAWDGSLISLSLQNKMEKEKQERGKPSENTKPERWICSLRRLDSSDIPKSWHLTELPGGFHGCQAIPRFGPNLFSLGSSPPPPQSLVHDPSSNPCLGPYRDGQEELLPEAHGTQARILPEASGPSCPLSNSTGEVGSTPYFILYK